MSFVNLYASDVWSAADIDNKVQALIRSRYSENDELKAARLGRTGEDPGFVAAVDAWIAQCVEQGRQARADMVLLHEVLVLEQAAGRLKQLVTALELDEEGNTLNQEQVDRDAGERTDAQTVLDAGSEAAKAWLEQRNPPVEMVEEPVVGLVEEPVMEGAEQ